MRSSLFTRSLPYYCFLVVVSLGLFVSEGIAATDPTVVGSEQITGFLDHISLVFQHKAALWETHFVEAAAFVFRTLLLIDLIYVSFDVLFLRGEDIRTWAGEILRQVLIIGFFSWMLWNSGTAVSVILDGFERLSGIASGLSDTELRRILSPSGIINEGLRNGGSMTLEMLGIKLDSPSAIDISGNIAVAFTGGIYTVLACLIGAAIIIIYCMIACRVLITQIEVYLSLSCGVVVLAFGGSRWTREPAIRYCWFLMALALKLFTIYMLISLGHYIIHDLFLSAKSSGFLNSISMWFTMIGCLAIWLVILWVIPNSVAQLVSHIGGVGGGGAAGVSAAAGLIGGSLAFAGSSVSTAVKGAATVATPATAGGGLAVAAAIAAGEKAMQAGVGVTSRMASQAGGVGQGRSGSSRGLGGIAKNIGPGSSGTSPMSSPSPRSAKSSGGASSKSSPSASGGGTASMAASAGTAALGGIAKGITGTVSGAASLGARGDLGAGKSTDTNLNPTYRPKENLRQNKP